MENLERQEYLNETSIAEYSGRLLNEEDKTKNENLNSNSNSNMENFTCKMPPIILDLKQRKTKPHYLNSDLALFEFIVKSLRNQRRTHSVSHLDDFAPNDPSRKIILDSVESFLKARGNGTPPKNPINLSKFKSVPKVMESEFGTCNKSLCIGTNIGTGLLHRVWKNGLPSFEFSTENPNGNYVASPMKIKSIEYKDLDLIYSFYEGGNAKKDLTSLFLGKMRVSSASISNPDGSSCKETEFVLYGSKDDYLKEMQNPSSSFVKNKGLMNKFTDMLKPNFSPLPRYMHKSAKSISSHRQIDINTCDAGTVECDINGTKEPVPNNIILDDYSTNLELATIIAKDEKKNKTKNSSETLIGGWGLKFLKKPETKLENNSKKRINVLVPKRFHGGPVGTSFGPSSLKARWTSNSCRCGGWDLGCPISVLSNGLDDSLHEKSHERRSEDLFLEGVRNGEPALKIVNVSENLYLVYFGSNLSPLQCFSIGVAIVHAQTPELYPMLGK